MYYYLLLNNCKKIGEKYTYITFLFIGVLFCREGKEAWGYEKTMELDGGHFKQTPM